MYSLFINNKEVYIASPRVNKILTYRFKRGVTIYILGEDSKKM